jgi:hypothetical protein
MLFEPWSTLDTLENNIAFLHAFCGDGASPVSFCRTLPYAGTPIEARLEGEGRLDKQDWRADYRFLDPRLDLLYDWGLSTFSHRNTARDGTANLLRVLGFEAALDLPERPRNPIVRSLVKGLTSVSNRILLDTVANALAHVRELDPADVVDGKSDPVLEALADAHVRHDERVRHDLVTLMARFPDIADHISVAE